MTTPINSNQVAQQLLDLARQLDAAVKELSRVDEQSVAARRDFEVAFAHAFITAEGSMDMKKQRAVLATADKKYAAELADQRVRSQREAIRAIGTRIEVGRSYGAAIRSEVGLAGMGNAA